MKNIFVAATAATVLVSGAFAQSNVTLYGELDAGVGQRYSREDVGVITNYDGTSRWGLRGAEDLGNGLKANFNFESGAISLADGSVGGNGGFNRQAWVGLSGGFGALHLGRTTTPQNRLLGTFDLNGTADGSSALKTLNLGANDNLGGSRQNAQIQYATPKLGGFEARIAYGFEDDRKVVNADGSVSNDKHFIQAAAVYKAGGLTIGGAVQSKLSSAANQRTGYALGAKYDFKTFVVSGYYTRDETKDTNTSRSGGDGFGLGVAAPIGAFKVGLQAAYLTHDNDAVDGATAFELFGDYNFSKRTRAYINFGSINDEGKTLRGYAEDYTFGIGLVHLF